MSVGRFARSVMTDERKVGEGGRRGRLPLANPFVGGLDALLWHEGGVWVALIA
jgi:hypothetical protein